MFSALLLSREAGGQASIQLTLDADSTYTVPANGSLSFPFPPFPPDPQYPLPDGIEISSELFQPGFTSDLAQS